MARYIGYPVAIFLTLFVSLHIFALPASAGVSITVSPTKIDLTLNTTEIAIQEINVQNPGSESTRIHAYAMDFSINEEGDFTFSDPGYESYSCATWLNIDEADFDLGPGETKDVKVTISVPQEVEPGGHYAALFFETVPPETQSGVSVAIAGRIPSLFYLTIPGITDADIVTNAEITSLLLPGWIEKGPVEIGVTVRNTGNVHLPIAAKAYFTDFRGRDAGELYLGQAVVLPDSERVIKATWEETPFIGKVKTSIVIGYFDQHGELVNRSQTGDFQVVPWKIIVVAISSICLLILLVLVLRKRFRFRIERREKQR
jgi:P pilus assembly chaperone PapD